MNHEVLLAIALLMALFFLFFLLLFFSVIRLWVQGLLSGTQIAIVEIIGMRLRRTPPTLIVQTAIVLRHRGESATAAEIEGCYLGYGNREMNANELADLVLEKRAPRSDAPSTRPE